MAQTAVPTFGRWRPEDQEFKVTIGCQVISRPVWAGTEAVQPATAHCPVVFLSFLDDFAKSPGGPIWPEYPWSLTHKLLLSPGDKQVTSVTPLGAP